METTVCTPKKGIIFFGAKNSGKTKLASEIISSYNADEQVFIPCRNREPGYNSLFQDFTERTKVVLYDDVSMLWHLLMILSLPDQIFVNRKYEKPFVIPKPRLIITLCENIIDADHVFKSTKVRTEFDIVLVNP